MKRKKRKRNPEEVKIERSMRFQSLSSLSLSLSLPTSPLTKSIYFQRLISFLVDKTSFELSVKTLYRTAYV